MIWSQKCTHVIHTLEKHGFSHIRAPLMVWNNWFLSVKGNWFWDIAAVVVIDHDNRQETNHLCAG
jgi:hypothetical protein